jgi:hypothetical protein
MGHCSLFSEGATKRAEAADNATAMRSLVSPVR